MILIIKKILTIYLVLGLVHTAIEYACMALSYYAFKKGLLYFEGKDEDMLSKGMELYPDLTSSSLFKNLYTVCKNIMLWPKDLLGAWKAYGKINDQIKLKV